MELKLASVFGSKSRPAAPGPDTTIMESNPAVAPRTDSPSRSTSPGKPGGVAAQLRLQGTILGIVVLIIAGLLVYQTRGATRATEQVESAGQLRTLSQQIAKSAQLAIQGNSVAFTELKAARDRFNDLLVHLGSFGNNETLESLGNTWAKTDKDASLLLDQEKNLTTLNQSVATINAKNPQLLELSEQVAAMKLQSGAGPREIAVANRVVMLTQRVAKNANGLMVADAVDPEVAFLLGKDTNTLRDLLAQLRQMGGDGELRAKIEELDSAAKDSLAAVGGILANVQRLVQAKQAGSRIFGESTGLLDQSQTLADIYARQGSFLSPANLLLMIAGLGALGILAVMARTYNNDLAHRQRDTDSQRQVAENERNQTQQAILRLMNEMGDLADGDLTIRATVSEDITGAIADSVNYTIEELSVLVRRINDAASRVSSATESAQNTSTQLIEATGRQSLEIEEAGATVHRMAQSMTDSSQRALESAHVARRSLEAAQKGASAVEDTIRGMSDIRDQIQETSKRIKRLGESSQEIGEIVELISDITEQTNVLALNAAIQAASAGEAGRGFTVVAEEVQRLAERSGEATKQIAAIVKTIQTDTKDAVGAMENATRDVVAGAELSDAAGRALAEIGDVSSETARLIEEISEEIQHQASSATRVAESMKHIRSITEQTTLGTQQTAVSIGQLADLAIELKGSVSGFKV
ncbi:MAG: type IV pili methyl-accepting chemotaxis transducer N-terminal domain-containing protein [Zoogloeaceae bacterium]|nr:type IV pili methyl-accepting chemotaxis transducer N-terminal domain-containing protein [Zoogloeaceae bacterium]